MPLTNREALQLGLLLLCVPLQFFLSNHFSTTVTQRSEISFQVANEIKHFQEYFVIDVKGTWRQFIGWLVKGFLKANKIDLGAKDGTNEQPESPAVEVMQYRQRNTGTAHQSIRFHRPPYLRYRVGQVVRHKLHGYKAVIVGWDLKAKTPDTTFPGVVFDTQSQLMRTTPHYMLLVDVRDSAANIKPLSPNHAYVMQTQLDVLKHSEVQHPDLSKYFLKFDGAQYIPKDSLRKIYPKD